MLAVFELQKRYRQELFFCPSAVAPRLVTGGPPRLGKGVYKRGLGEVSG